MTTCHLFRGYLGSRLHQLDAVAERIGDEHAQIAFQRIVVHQLFAIATVLTIRCLKLMELSEWRTMGESHPGLVDVERRNGGDGLPFSLERVSAEPPPLIPPLGCCPSRSSPTGPSRKRARLP